MLSYTDIKEGVYVLLDGEPYEVVSAVHSKHGRQKAVVQAQCKHIISGKVTAKTFRQAERVEELEMEKEEIVFIYRRGDTAVFHPADEPSKRFELSVSRVKGLEYLAEKGSAVGLEIHGEVVSAEAPTKVDLKVAEAPPSIRGNTTQGGTKQITLETGAVVSAPLFIEQGDVVRVNTQTGLYVERITKK